MRTLILVVVETETCEQSEYCRKEAARLLSDLLRQKRYVVKVQAETLEAGSIAAELAEEIARLHVVLDTIEKRRPVSDEPRANREPPR